MRGSSLIPVLTLPHVQLGLLIKNLFPPGNAHQGMPRPTYYLILVYIYLKYYLVFQMECFFRMICLYMYLMTIRKIKKKKRSYFY